MALTDISSIPFSLPRSRLQCKNFGIYYRKIWWQMDSDQKYLNDRINSQISDQNIIISNINQSISDQNTLIRNLTNDLNTLLAAHPQDPVAIAAKQNDLGSATLLLQSIQSQMIARQNQLANMTTTYNHLNDQITSTAQEIQSKTDFKILLENQITNIELILRFLTKNDLDAINQQDPIERVMLFNDRLLSQLQISASSALNDMIASLQATNYDTSNQDVIDKINRCFSIEIQQQTANQIYSDITKGIIPVSVTVDSQITNVVGDPA